jgi:pyridoxine 5'-phosphate synthase PdxJ
MAATEEIIKIACDVGPELATIVPEKRQELTTEGGINVIDNISLLKDTIKELHESNIEVSLFVEPDLNHIDAAAEIEADFIEFIQVFLQMLFLKRSNLTSLKEFESHQSMQKNLGLV